MYIKRKQAALTVKWHGYILGGVEVGLKRLFLAREGEGIARLD